MSQFQGPDTVDESKITFIGKQTAQVDVSPNTKAKAIIKQLDLIKTEAVILVLAEGISTFDDEQQKRLFQLFSRGLAHAIERNHTILTDERTDSKIVTALDEALVVHANKASLAEVVDESKAIEPDRSGSNNASTSTKQDSNRVHLVVTKSVNQGYEIDKMYEIVEELSRDIPILTILVNGGSEVLRSVRRGWPILVITDSSKTGSDKFGDKIEREWQNKQKDQRTLIDWQKSGSVPPKPKPYFIPDPVLAEVIADGDLHFFSIQNTPENLELYINLRLGATNLLNQAFLQQKCYEMNADRHKKTFQQQQSWMLLLGIFITALAAFQSFYKQMHWNWILPLTIGGYTGSVADVLYLALITVPVGLSILIAIANRFDDGNKWLTMQAAALAIKREIFRYRTHTDIYSDTKVGVGGTREVPLANRLETITRQWIEGKVDFGSLYPLPTTSAPQKRLPYSIRQTKPSEQVKPTNNLSSYLPPHRYVTVRLVKELDSYSKKTPSLARQFALLQSLILILGGSATLWTIIHAELIITVSTACATALGVYLNYNQVTNSLRQYNHAILSLTNIKNWWDALGEAQVDPDNIEKLVEYVETTLQSEQVGWIQQAQTNLTALRAQQTNQGTGASVTEPTQSKNQPPNTSSQAKVPASSNQNGQETQMPESSVNGQLGPATSLKAQGEEEQ